MSTQPTFAQVTLAFDNRQALPSDISEQITLGLQDGIIDPLAVTITTLVQANMGAPDAGLNLVSLALSIPDGTDTEEIEALLTEVCEGLDIPTSGYLSVASVTVLE
jgi:hypothetical protein